MLLRREESDLSGLMGRTGKDLAAETHHQRSVNTWPPLLLLPFHNLLLSRNCCWLI